MQLFYVEFVGFSYLPHLDMRLKLLTRWRQLRSHLVNLVTPRVGEVARCSAIKRTDNVPLDKLFGTVVLERVVDTLLFGIVVLITVVTQLNQLGNFLEQSGAAIRELSAFLFQAFS